MAMASLPLVFNCRNIRTPRCLLLKKLSIAFLLMITFYLIIDKNRLSKISKVQNKRDQLFSITQINRKQRIATVCFEELKNSSYLQEPVGRFLFYSPLRFSYCVVAKAGCSFWISVVRILLQDFGRNVTKQYPMDVNKLEAHGPRSKMRHLTQKNGLNLLLKSTKFFFARNPYTRLFSGYVDKIFLPELWHSQNIYIAKLTRKNYSKNRPCVNDLSFAEFLRYVVHSEVTNRNRNGHWIPIYRTCNPCMWNFDFIGKQETFIKDSLTILNYFGLAHMMKNYSHVQNMEYQTKSQIEYTFYANNQQLSRCGFDYNIFAERLWKAFQFQGYIHRKSALPEIQFGSDVVENVGLFQKAVVQEIRTNTISYTESSVQKKKMMYEAYSNVHPAVIRNIQQVYDLDFKLFGYNKDSFKD